MNSPPLPVTESQATVQAAPALRWWVRGGLMLIVLGWVAVFAVAAWLKPYGPDGQPLRMETHRQLGLPPCTFKYYTSRVIPGGLPCPSCGMTTSFSLLMHGDLTNSLKANAAGTFLAMIGLLFVPWAAACVIARRYFFIASLDLALLKIVIAFVALMLLRWVVVMALIWVNGTG